jgi:hypothetical protein
MPQDDRVALSIGHYDAPDADVICRGRIVRRFGARASRQGRRWIADRLYNVRECRQRDNIVVVLSGSPGNLGAFRFDVGSCDGLRVRAARRGEFQDQDIRFIIATRPGKLMCDRDA